MPRFLQEHRFDMFYMNSEKGAIGNAIHDFMRSSYAYCQAHEAEIRAHIAAAENQQPKNGR